MNSVSHIARGSAQNMRSEVAVLPSVALHRTPQISVTNEIPVRSTFQHLTDSVASPVLSRPCLAIMAAADLVGLFLAGMAAEWSQRFATQDIAPSTYWVLWPVFGLVIVTNLLVGIYRGGAVNSIQELRRHTLASGSLFLLLICVMPWVPNGLPHSRQVLISVWLISLPLVPTIRAIAKADFSRFSWWGQSAVVLVASKAGPRIVNPIMNQPDTEIRPVVMVDDNPIGRGYWRGVPIVTRLEMAPLVVNQFGARCAIVAIAGMPRKRTISLLKDQAHTFTSLLDVPDLFDFSTLWVSARGSGGVLGVEVRPAIFGSTAQMFKRASDVVGVLLIGMLTLPLIALIMLAIKLDSAGPVIYGHRRTGRGGHAFLAWKFRSMVVNADCVLHDHLQRNSKARDEWESKQKLRSDPRVTRIGRFLRKSSLDELPQLWNVLVGEMSLVGPRPIISAEKHHYRERIALYERVLPGLSGLWQVSGRSDTSYEERVQLDSYYVRNWSFWLDLCILARTIPALIFGRGAC